MPRDPQTPPSHRLTTSDDLEVSAYLEIARERSGQGRRSAESRRIHRETVLVVDFGSQYSRLIARRVRESKVYCELVSHKTTWEEIADLNPRGVILSGGPASVYDDGESGCWYCGSRKHFAQSCPQPERERNPSLAFGGRLGR